MDVEDPVAIAPHHARRDPPQVARQHQPVDPRAFEDFAAKLSEKARALKVGDPRQPDTDIGPLVSARQRDRVTGHVEDDASGRFHLPHALQQAHRWRGVGRQGPRQVRRFLQDQVRRLTAPPPAPRDRRV